jgi:malate dehydrogenase (quinone)
MLEHQVDVLLVGGGVMSATLGTLLARLDPDLEIAMAERLDAVALESSDGWNNAGTGHAGYCELNYTPQQPDGSVAIQRALGINAAFEVSLQLWSSLVEQGALPTPGKFINPTPHASFVWGEADVAFLRERHARLSAHPLFEDMAYSEDHATIREWMPLVMGQRSAGQQVAATRVSYGSDVDFGALTRHLVAALQKNACFELMLNAGVVDLYRQTDGRWRVRLENGRTLIARFVFLGAGGGTLPLLQKSGIPEGRGYGGFPVSGQWLVCRNPDIARHHHAKVYGKAPLGAPPMSVPHLDTRIIAGQPALLFGPYAGFTTKFLKQGSFLDLVASVKPNNLNSMLAAGRDNMDLTRYLIGEAFQSHKTRVGALRQFFPEVRDEEWTLAHAGKRVQIIKHGKLEFGTEVVTAADGSLAALLGASPGASTSAQAMLGIVERCFAGRMQDAEWQRRMKALVPSYGQSLVDDADLLRRVRARTLDILKLR